MRRSLVVFPIVFPAKALAAIISCAAVILAVSPRAFSQSPSGTPTVTLPGSQSPFLGSNPEEKATPNVLQIDFKDAIDRGLRNNLGLLLASDQTETARGERWKQLAELLPDVQGKVQESAQNLSLAALGFNKLFPCSRQPGAARVFRA